jgi:hypothetical protein
VAGFRRDGICVKAVRSRAHPTEPTVAPNYTVPVGSLRIRLRERIPTHIGTVGAALIATVLLAVLPGQALATHVQCGDVITKDTRLDADLLDCPGDGVLIGASNVTLDLGGHTIDGIGTTFSHRPFGVVADIERLIEVGWDPLPAALSGVTIENGSIRDFAYGVALEVVDDSTIRRLALSDNGIWINRSDRVRVERNSLNGTGIGVASSRDALIERNLLANAGIGTAEASRALVTRNVISRGGISVGNSGVDNAIIHNTVAHGVVGIRTTDDRTRVERNFVYSNEQDGIHVDCCGALVIGNRAIANGDDGIEVAFVSDFFGPDFVSRNTANENGDLGIEAVAGVADGGRNRARRNGNASQCVNVVCR